MWVKSLVYILIKKKVGIEKGHLWNPNSNNDLFVLSDVKRMES